MDNAKHQIELAELINGWLLDVQESDAPLPMYISDGLTENMARAAWAVLNESRTTQAWLKAEGMIKDSTP